ncbi:hypothetical protein HMPREF2867_09935 [Streptococcus sp. HMSC064H09]|uniref:DUF7448 domain-containing protein n=1 Tax=Streptococcus sp. HMSC064H09 TaxID=1739371 RepID=UPI0008A51829|nr:hypothetical protein [Streptococcus sp. HMSC064H09]OFR76745.1 hypothetical protein HMPREF2867_09935 [Streptococcus sp. HMSC064H09]
MTETIKLLNGYKPDWENVRYGSLEELKELLLYKRIVKWDKNFLLLEDGTRVTIEMSESDCCAYAGGEFKDVKLDAIITDIKIGEQVTTEEIDSGESESKNTVTIYHNQNPIALAECEANDGNGGYYYSVGSLVVGRIHFPVVEA